MSVIKAGMIFYVYSLILLFQHVPNITATKCPLVELTVTTSYEAGAAAGAEGLYKVDTGLEASWAPNTPVYKHDNDEERYGEHIAC